MLIIINNDANLTHILIYTYKLCIYINGDAKYENSFCLHY